MKALCTTTLLFGLGICSLSFAQPGTRDPNFGDNGFSSLNIGTGSDYARTVTALPDGKVIVAGNRVIDSYGSSIASVARSMPDGSPDMSFGMKGAATVSYGTGIYTGGPAGVQPDGKVIITGAYQFGNDDYDVVAARLNTDGTLDKSFGTEGKVRVTFGALYDFSASITIQPNGKIVIGGYSQTGSRYLFALARYNADGTADNSFGTGGMVTTQIDQNNILSFVDVQQDGKIIAGGTSSDGTQNAIALARYNSDGSPDVTFSDDGKATIAVDGNVTSLVHAGILSDGKLIVAGDLERGSTSIGLLGRVKADGTLDSTFGSNGLVYPEAGMIVSAAHLSIDGKVLLTGSKDDAKVFLARYNAEGTPDNSFVQGGVITADPGLGSDRGSALDIQANGNVVVAADVSGQTAQHFVIMEWTSKGAPEDSWGTNGRADIAVGQGNDYVYSTVVQADGRILVIGTSFNGAGDDLSIAGYTPDGKLDLSFGTMGFTTANITGINGGSMTTGTGPAVLQPDGKLIIAGELYEGNVAKIAITRFTKDGVLDATFGNAGSVTTALGNDGDGAYAAALQSDGKIVITGYSLNSSSVYEGIAIRYQPNGSVDSSFGSEGITRFAFGSVDLGLVMAIRPDGKIVIAGQTTMGNDVNLVVLQLNSDGSIDKSFGTNGSILPSLSSGVDGAWSIGLQKDGKIVLGAYMQPGPSYDAVVLRYTADGKPDADFGTGGKTIVAMDAVKEELLGSLAIQADGKILVSGYSGHFAGYGFDNSTPILLRLNADGSIDNSFGTNGRVISAFDGEYYGMGKLALQPDGNIIVAVPAVLNNQVDFGLMRLQSGSNLGVVRTEHLPQTARLYHNASTAEWTLVYESAQQESTTISLIDMQGRTVQLIQPVSATAPGKHTFNINTSGLARGVYVLRLKNGTTETDIKMMN